MQIAQNRFILKPINIKDNLLEWILFTEFLKKYIYAFR